MAELTLEQMFQKARSTPRRKNILSCESAVDIRGFGRSVAWDDEFQINGLWLRQASRCEVSEVNSGRKSQSARTVSAG